MSFLQSIGDSANILVNGATFGLFNRGMGALTGHSAADVDAFNAATRERMGTTGDVINGVAQVLPIARFAKGAQVAGRAVQALRGVTAAEEAAPVLSTLARIRAAPVRYGTIAALGSVAGRGSRVMAAEPGAAPDAAAAPAAGGAAAVPVVMPAVPRGGRDAHGNLSIYSDEGFRYAMDVANARAAAANGGQAPAAAAAAAPAAPTLTPFQRQLAAFGQNGGVSLNELAVLSEASHNAQEPPARPARVPTGRDVAAHEIMNMADQLFAQRAAAAQQLASTDQAAGQRAYASAVAERMAALQGILGQNPINEAVGQGMRSQDDEE
jgi:hypothetical protein